MKRPKWEIVLHALECGQSVTFGDHEYTSGESTDGVTMLCIKATRSIDGQSPESVLLGVDISLNHFIRECEKMSDDDVAILGYQGALKDMKR